MSATMMTPIFAQLAQGLSLEYGLDKDAILALCQNVLKSCTVKVSSVDESPAPAEACDVHKCCWVMKRSDNPGTCPRNAVSGDYCKQHALLVEKAKSKPEQPPKVQCTYIYIGGSHPGKQCTNNSSKSTLPIHVVACSTHEKSLYQRALKAQEAEAKLSGAEPKSDETKSDDDTPVVVEKAKAPVVESESDDDTPVVEKAKAPVVESESDDDTPVVEKAKAPAKSKAKAPAKSKAKAQKKK